MLAKAAESLPSNSSPFIGEAGKTSSSRKPSAAKGGATQQEPGAQAQKKVHAQTQPVQADGTQEAAQAETMSKRKAKKPPKTKKPASAVAQDPPPIMNAEVSRNGNDMDSNVKRGKGWRNTPLLQPSPHTSSPNQKGSGKKTRRQQQEEKEQRNGWATEDATDIQDLGDFDFEANHKLFDKKQVFDELRQGDTTADEDRLVSHNKLHRPGTHGGKNLHPTENVLSPKLGPKYHSNEADSTSDADTELNFAANGRSSSRHSATRVATKKQPSRQNSAQVDSRPHPFSASMSSDRPLSRTAHSYGARPGRTVPSIGTSPMPDRTHSPQSTVSTSKPLATPLLATQQLHSHLAVAPGLTPCPVLLPTALDTLEKETVARYGLTHDAVTESAARSIAEMAMNLLDTSSSRRGSRANTLQRGMSMTSGLGIDRAAPPILVIIAGNHTIGARALAAARHLVCRRTKIIIAEAQYESPEMQDTQAKTQLAMLKRIVKAGASIKRGPWRRVSGYIKNLPGPPALIIDALLGGTTYESFLDCTNPEYAAEVQKETREMIGWANRSRAPVLSIGCPSGVSGTDGSTTTYEGEPLAVRPDKLLCLAAPMQGILNAMNLGERWETSLADVGLNITLRSDEAVAFGNHWVVDLKFVASGNLDLEQQP